MQGRIRYGNAEACLQAAAAGLGLACVPSFVAGASLRAGALRRAAREGDLEGGCFMAGQAAGLIRCCQGVEEMLQDIFDKAQQCLQEGGAWAR